MVVDSLDAVFGEKVKEDFGGFGCNRFHDLAKSPQIKCLCVSGCGLNVLGVLILLLLVQGTVAVLDLGNQGGVKGFTKKLPEKHLG